MNRKYPSYQSFRKSISCYLGSIFPVDLGKQLPPNIYNSNSMKGSSYLAECLFRVPPNVVARGQSPFVCFAVPYKKRLIKGEYLSLIIENK